MMNREDDENPVIDRLVREYLDRNTNRVHSGALVERLLAEQSQEAPFASTSHRSSVVSGKTTIFHWSRFHSWWGIAALAVVVAFFSGRHLNEHSANASIIVRYVQSEHARGIDYCYRVQFDPDPRYWNPKNRLEGPSLSRLWTRGDRFWADCAIGDIRFKLGHEADGTVWISPSRKKGIRFSNQPEHLPETVAQICQINSMNVPRLMNEVLVDFVLSSQTMSGVAGGERTLVWAQLKPGRTHPLLSHALLEIDPRSNILVRLVLWTVHDGKPRGTVTFTLLERATLDEDQYELATHLNPDAKIEIQTLPPPDYELDLRESAEDD